MLYDLQKAKELQEARKKNEQVKAKKNLNKYSTGKNKGLSKDTIGKAKNLVKNATPLGFFSLMFKIRPLADWMYGLALMAAILKDLLDISQATGILYILVLVTTLCCSIFIAMMMILGSFTHSGTGRVQRKIIRSWLVLLSGTTAELLFGVNFLPIETLTVFIIYGLMLMERKQAQNEEKEKERALPGSGYADDYAYRKAA